MKNKSKSGIDTVMDGFDTMMDGFGKTMDNFFGSKEFTEAFDDDVHTTIRCGLSHDLLVRLMAGESLTFKTGGHKVILQKSSS